MARRNHSLLDDLVTLPWWSNVILAGIVYVSLKFWLPTVEFQNPVFKGMATGLPNVAHYFAGILLLVAALSALHAWRKRRLLEQQTDVASLNAVTWREFEELVGEAYRRQGYRVTETGGAGADGGVDLVLKKDGETVLVQCKQWKTSKVGVKVVRELYGVLMAEGATRGVLISSGTYIVLLIYIRTSLSLLHIAFRGYRRKRGCDGSVAVTPSTPIPDVCEDPSCF